MPWEPPKSTQRTPKSAAIATKSALRAKAPKSTQISPKSAAIAPKEYPESKKTYTKSSRSSLGLNTLNKDSSLKKKVNP